MTTKKKSNPKIPKDLGLKMGTEDERNWTGVKDQAKAAVKNAEFTIKLNEAVIIMATIKIMAERKRFKQG